VVMDSPPALEDVRPWLAVRDLLEAGGVRVPQVLARDVENGFLLLEDLGGPTLAQVLDADNADALFDGAIDQLLKLQAIPPPPSDRKSTRLNSSHVKISYAVFCLKKKKT